MQSIVLVGYGGYYYKVGVCVSDSLVMFASCIMWVVGKKIGVRSMATVDMQRSCALNVQNSNEEMVYSSVLHRVCYWQCALVPLTNWGCS